MADQPNPISTAGLIPKTTAYAKTYMSQPHFDGSHNFSHLLRVLGLAYTILSALQDPTSKHYHKESVQLDKNIVTLACLLHDVGDRKYLKEGEDGERMVGEALVRLGADRELAERVQTICTNVSWTNERKDPDAVKALIDGVYPELAIVQDADRLDALGAVGVGRVFMYGAVRNRRGMRHSVGMFERVLYDRAETMKTAPGREMALERVNRIKVFEGWFAEEVLAEGKGIKALGEAGIPEGDLVVKIEETPSEEGQRTLLKEELRAELREELRIELKHELMKEIMNEGLPN